MHILWIQLAASLLIAGVCVPLVLHKIPKNDWYGVRTPRTLNGSDENWYETNHMVGQSMLYFAAISAAADIVLGLIPIPFVADFIVATMLLLAVVLIPLLVYRKRLF